MYVLSVDMYVLSVETYTFEKMSEIMQIRYTVYMFGGELFEFLFVPRSGSISLYLHTSYKLVYIDWM